MAFTRNNVSKEKTKRNKVQVAFRFHIKMTVFGGWRMEADWQTYKKMVWRGHASRNSRKM